METSTNVIVEKRNSIFQNRNFLILFLGKLVSKLGDNICFFAFTWYILDKYESPAKAGIVMMVSIIPAILIGPFGGIIADRINRKKIIVVMDLIQGMVVFGLVALLYADKMNILVLYIAAALLGLCGAIFNPACNALIPNIVDENQLTDANSTDTIINSLTSIIGVIIGGILYVSTGFMGVCLINAVSFIISGILEMFIQIPSNKNIKNSHVNGKSTLDNLWKDLLEGYNFLRSNRGMSALFWFNTILNFLVAPIFVIYVPYIFNKLLNATSNQLSYVLAADGIGAIIGAILMSAFFSDKKFSRLVLTSFVISNILLAFLAVPVIPQLKGGFSIWGSVIFYIVVAASIGALTSIINIPIGTVFQKAVPDDIRGRVTALVGTISMAAMPLGYLVGGIVAEYIPIFIIIIFISAVMMIVNIFMSRVKELKSL